MKIFKQNSHAENVTATLTNFLALVKVSVTDTSIQKTQYHKDYPSLLSISDALHEWNIENLTAKLTVSQLREIPYPAITHLYKHQGHFVVLQKLEDETLTYIDAEVGFVRESLSEFEKKWSGVVLLTETTEKSGEEGYAEKRKAEQLQNLGVYLSLALTFAILLLPVATLAWPQLIIYIANVVGGLFAFVLLQKQVGLSSKKLDVFCRMGNAIDCDAVINSLGSKVAGFHLSEIGVLYFSGNILTIIIGAFSSVSVFNVLLIASAFALPISISAIYYQGWVLKKWCPLCLSVMVMVWLAFAFNVIFVNHAPVNTLKLAIAFIAFSIPLIFWLPVRHHFFEFLRIDDLEKKVFRLLKSERIFQKLMDDQPSILVNSSGKDIQSGGSNVPIQIILVTNPTGNPCAFAYSQLERISDQLQNKFNITYKFLITDKSENSSAYKVASTLFYLKLRKSNTEALNALSSWFEDLPKSNTEAWFQKYAAVPGEACTEVNQIIDEHVAWCTSAGIKKTPTLIINGKEVPDEYSISDLKYHLRTLMSVNRDGN